MLNYLLTADIKRYIFFHGSIFHSLIFITRHTWIGLFFAPFIICFTLHIFDWSTKPTFGRLFAWLFWLRGPPKSERVSLSLRRYIYKAIFSFYFLLKVLDKKDKIQWMFFQSLRIRQATTTLDRENWILLISRLHIAQQVLCLLPPKSVFFENTYAELHRKNPAIIS